MRRDLNASVAGDSLCNLAETPNGILLPELPKYEITGTHTSPPLDQTRSFHLVFKWKRLNSGLSPICQGPPSIVYLQ